MIKQTTAYESLDGRLFKDEAAAAAHNARNAELDIQLNAFSKSEFCEHASGSEHLKIRKAIRSWEQFKAVEHEKNVLRWPIRSMGLSVRLRNSLRAENIKSLCQLKGLYQEDLLKIPNFGKHSQNELNQVLVANGLPEIPKRP